MNISHNKKYLAILIGILVITTSFIGIYYYENGNVPLTTTVNSPVNNYKIDLKPAVENQNSSEKINNYTLEIYMETPNSINKNFTTNPNIYNRQIFNSTLPFNNYTAILNGSILSSISNCWYNYINAVQNPQLIYYRDNLNALSMQAYAFTQVNTNNSTYVYTYFNNILYNPINILNYKSFNYSLNVNFNMSNPTYIFHHNQTYVNPEYITPGPGSNCKVYEKKVCDYNHDNSYTPELNQTTYNNSYLPLSVMYLNDKDNNSDHARYLNEIVEYDTNNKVYFKMNDTTTFSSSDTVQSTTPSYQSDNLSICSIYLGVDKSDNANIFGIPDSTIQITNYKAVVVTDYKYTVYTCFYRNGQEVRHTSSTHAANYTNKDIFATLKVLNIGNGMKNVGFHNTSEYSYALGFYHYLLRNNPEILNKTIGAGDSYSVATASLNVSAYTNAYDELNKVLEGANLFLANLGVDLAVMSAFVAFADIGGAAGYALAASSLAVAAGSLGVAIAQASQPISIGENINAQFNDFTLTNEKINPSDNPYTFIMYKSEYPEYIEYNGAEHAVYMPEQYIYVTTN